jgi:AcrR family transcriptional regulator
MASNTKKELSDALLQLCESKSLARIRIREVIELAGTGRQTFYNHFRNKNDLVNWTWEVHLSGAGLLDGSKNLYEYILQVSLLHAKRRKFFLQACALGGQNSLVDYIIEHNRRNYTALVRERLAAIEGAAADGSLPKEVLFAIDFNAYGANYMHIKWVRENMPIPPEAFARQLVEAIPSELKKYLTIE